jgi:hypothetical protein
VNLGYFCDVAELAIMHKNILAKFGYRLDLEVENFQEFIYFGHFAANCCINLPTENLNFFFETWHQILSNVSKKSCFSSFKKVEIRQKHKNSNGV